MKNWINKIPKEKLQKYAFLGMLVLVFAAFFISLAFIGQGDKPDDSEKPVPQNPDDDEEPIVKEAFVLPIGESEYSIIKKFYDRAATKEEQELAIIKYGSQYSMSRGISIASKDKKAFDVLCSMSGVVTAVNESPLYGFVVTVEHDEDIVTEYSSLATVKVKVGDVVKQKDVLGTSGKSEYDSESEIHLHFKVSKNNAILNPESVIGKQAKAVK